MIEKMNDTAQWATFLVSCPKKLMSTQYIGRGDKAKSTFPGLLAFTYSCHSSLPSKPVTTHQLSLKTCLAPPFPLPLSSLMCPNSSPAPFSPLLAYPHLTCIATATYCCCALCTRLKHIKSKWPILVRSLRSTHKANTLKHDILGEK